MLKQELMEYKGIILVSGDGLPHEAINGIFNRADREEASKVPIGVLPGGSGNAMAKTISFLSGFSHGNESCAMIIGRGHVRSCDLIEFDLENGKKVYSFLSFTWAYISETDLGSEPLRFLGEARFEVYGTWRAIFQRSFPGTVYVSNQEDTKMPEIQQDMGEWMQQNPEWQSMGTKDFTYFTIQKMPFLSESVHSAPFVNIEDGMMDLQSLTRQDGWFQLVNLALKFQQGQHVNIEQKKVIEGSRWKYDKIKAFRLEPSSTVRSDYSLDGERYDQQRVQGKVIKGALRIFCI